MTGMKTEIFPVLLSRRGTDHQVADGAALPMGCITAYIKHYKSGKLLDNFTVHPLVDRTRKKWGFYTKEAQRLKGSASIWLFSNYVWTADDNLEVAKAIKAIAPNALIIMGGPHVPGYVAECEDYFAKYPFIDVAVRGEGEVTAAEILEVIANNNGAVDCDLSAVAGLTFRHRGKVTRTADRARSKNLDEFPSPYLTGEFDDASFDNAPTMVLESNRGCPYGCTYCDWGSATLQKIKQFDLQRVLKEIDYMGSKHPRNIYIADANFGAFERDIEIAKAIVRAKQQYGFPKNVSSSNSKNASPIIGKVVKVLIDGGLISQGVVAIQTTDDQTLDAVRRSNIKTSNFEKLMDVFREENLPLSSELLIGLPGQTYESHKADLQYIFDRKLTAICFPVQIMPNAPMNDPEYRDQYKISVNDQKFVIATSSFSSKDLDAMQILFLSFQFFYMLGVLKYLLYYLQLEHNVKAMDFIHTLLNATTSDPQNYPIGHMTRKKLIPMTSPRNVGVLELLWETEDAEFLFNHLDEYYDEIFKFAQEHFDIKLSPSEAQTLKAVQMGVMPSLGKKVPQTIDLEHDFVKYFDQIKSVRIVDKSLENFRPLRSFLPGTLTVSALKPKVIDNLTLLMTNARTAMGWELRSPLRFVVPRTRIKSVEVA